jgi:restriction system protein
MSLGFGPISSGPISGGPTILVPLATAPSVLLQAVIIAGDRTTEGQLIEAVALPWFEIIDLINNDPQIIYQIDWRKWEEIIAGAYDRAGFDEVVLTPRSNDKGRDVIATKNGIGSIRFFDQVKAYSPGNVVPAEDVRSLLGVLTRDQNVSKGILTTTSTLPHRIELKPKDKLIPWLIDLAKRRP